MAIIGLQKGSGKRSRVREKSLKSQGILIWIMSGNPELGGQSICTVCKDSWVRVLVEACTFSSPSCDIVGVCLSCEQQRDCLVRSEQIWGQNYLRRGKL